MLSKHGMYPLLRNEQSGCNTMTASWGHLGCLWGHASELQERGFLYQDTINECYPQRDFHTMYVGKIEKVLVRDDEYQQI